jgi:hypothetical protein
MYIHKTIIINRTFIITVQIILREPRTEQYDSIGKFCDLHLGGARLEPLPEHRLS